MTKAPLRTSDATVLCDRCGDALAASAGPAEATRRAVGTEFRKIGDDWPDLCRPCESEKVRPDDLDGFAEKRRNLLWIVALVLIGDGIVGFARFGTVYPEPELAAVVLRQGVLAPLCSLLLGWRTLGLVPWLGWLGVLSACLVRYIGCGDRAGRMAISLFWFLWFLVPILPLLR